MQSGAPTVISESLDKFCYLNLEVVKPPVTGIVLRFPGLNGGGMRGDSDPGELEWGQQGLVSLTPYHEPWAWMNPRVVQFIDDLVDATRARHHIGQDVPLISTGGSMGGHAALLYSMKARHPVKACMALWPVCDLNYHFNERIDLPRTLYHAYNGYGPLESVLRENSPLHTVERMPDIPYLLVHGEKDTAVKKSAHSDPQVAVMRARGLRVEYIERSNFGHGGPMDWDLARRMVDFVLNQRGA